MEDKSKVAKSERTRQVHLGKRKQVDERILDLQKIINKMVSVDRIANEFYLLGIYIYMYMYIYAFVFLILNPYY
jgi:hypothetical protein